MQDGGIVTVAMISRDACKTSIIVHSRLRNIVNCYLFNTSFFLITRTENYFTKLRFKASNQITIHEKKTSHFAFYEKIFRPFTNHENTILPPSHENV